MGNLEHQIRQFWEERISAEQRREILAQLEASGMEWWEFMLKHYGEVLSGEKASELSGEQKGRVWKKLQEQQLGGRVAKSGWGIGSDWEAGERERQVIGRGGRGANGGVRAGGTEPRVTERGGRIGGRPDGDGGAGPGGRGMDGRAEGARVIGLSWRNGWLPWMAAACVLLVVAVWLSRMDRKDDGDESMVSNVSAPQMIVRKNVSAVEDSLRLSDHSVVLLAPGSSIRYQQGFETSARHIQLEGKALFEVAKDSLRPFTVTTHGFATTALATRFVVDATKPEVLIRLINGKVVVNSAANALVALQKVYLVPGQELKINTTKRHFSLKSVESNTDGEVNLALSFERTSLINVFQRLGEYYHVPIRYDKAEVQGLSFTGNFKSGDGLDLTLKVICNVNQLSFVKENGRIVVSKQQ